MKISRVEIKNYRSIDCLDLKVDKFTALIGANGSGKSTVLYAIRWLLDGGEIDDQDIHGYKEENASTFINKEISVKVAFDSLTDIDKERLGKYGRGHEAVFKRVWSQANRQSKVFGNAQQGPGFSVVLNSTSAADMRRQYQVLQSSVDGLARLPGNASQQAIRNELERWENDPANSELLEDVESVDANHLFGVAGTSRIKECFNFILIPAAKTLEDEINGNSKGSVITDLVGIMTNQAVKTAREAWVERNKTILNELTIDIQNHVNNATQIQVIRINDNLKQLVANAAVDIKPVVPDWTPTPTPNVNTSVSIDNNTHHITRQGHGVQRAVMIAMLEAIAPDKRTLEAIYEPASEGETEDEKAENLRQLEERLPFVCVCIEEPEIYQHPVRSRAFARVLRELSEDLRTQVIIATHSPYFVLPEQFANLRKFDLKESKTSCRFTTTAAIAAETGWHEADIKKTIQKEIPEIFSEGFFADAVVLCEGPTDIVVLTELANKLARPFDAHGIQLLPMESKENIVKPRAILDALGSKIYCVVDADFDGASRKHPATTTEWTTCHNTHQSKTEAFIGKTPAPTTKKTGTIPYRFGQDTVVSNMYTIWRDDIESELANWPSFMARMLENNYTLRSEKNVYAYRKCVIEADTSDIPENLRLCIEAIHDARISTP